MNWTDHVELISKSLSSAAGALSRCRHFFPEKVKLQIYYDLFESHLHYCALVWATTTKANIRRWLVPFRRTNYLVQSLRHSLPSLLNKVVTAAM
ncbi:uncharacterized protein LOC142767921 [Rhipicephalus microplus]|uniref:uncharacterized protein LOC142767921 n=1 Tax=Rhipicephalus microplus TaxID=6941 RepID=UPI003F6B01B2